MKIGKLKYNGTEASTLGVFVSGEGSFNAAELDITPYSIPGRNGDLFISNNRYKNIEVTYPAFIPNDFETRAQQIRNWLRSSEGYVKIEDNYDQDHYRMGVAKGLHKFNPVNQNRAANCQLIFDCKPQRFLKSGDEPVPIGEWGETTQDSGELVSFDYPNDHGAFKALSTGITATQDLNGYSSPWPPGGGKNKAPAPSVENGWRNGYFQANGTIGGQNEVRLEMCYLDYIAIPSGETNVTLTVTFTDTIPDTRWSAVCFYDAETTFLSREVSTSQNDTSVFAIPENTAFVRPTCRTFGMVDYLQLEFGNTATDYAPYSNICPITGLDGTKVNITGKNIWNEQWELGDINITNGQKRNRSDRCRSKDFISVVPSETYYIVSNYSNTVVCFYDENQNWLGGAGSYIGVNNVTFIVPSWCYYIMFYYNGTSYNNDVAINYPATETIYTPYNGSVYPVTWQSEVGTVYGGTVDIVSGVLTVNYGMATIDENTGKSFTEDGKVNINAGGYFGMASGSFYSDNNVKCDNLEKIADASKLGIRVGADNARIYIFKANTLPGVSDITTFNAWLENNPIHVTIPLATPLTYQLSPTQVSTLLGQNNVWTESGEVSVEYGDDPGIVHNPTVFKSSPIIKVSNPSNGATITAGGRTMTCSAAYSGEVVIDCDLQTVYSGLTNLNNKWSGSFPVLSPGNNSVSFSGCDAVEVVPKWWEL